MKKIITKSKEETKKFADNFAKQILLAKSDLASTEKQKSQMSKSCHGKILTSKAKIIGLIGNLGAGKTTFTQGFAKGLGVKQKIISPTFVILKKFKITNLKSQNTNFQNFIHIDAYRLDNPEELLNLKWRDLTDNPQNMILVEWADKIKKILPKNCIKINFKFINENKREIIINQILNIKM